MSEEETVGVEDLATPQESEEAQQPAAEEQTNQQVQSDADKNWAEARRKMRELERLAQQQQQLIEELRAAKQEPEEDISSIPDDEIVTARQAKALAKKLAQDAVKEVVSKQESATLEDQLRRRYPDLDEVLSEENIEKLKNTDPKLADSIGRMQDQYSKAVMAYTAIKNTVSPTSLEKKKALENARKPVAAQAVAKQSSPMGNAALFENGLTPDLKASLYKEMMESAKGF